MKDFYYILGITSNATPVEVNSAYRKLSRKFQPDNHMPDDFLENHLEDIREAYATLGDPAKRLKYNTALKKYQQNKLYYFQVSYISIAATLALITLTGLFGWYVIRSITKVKTAPLQKVAVTPIVKAAHRKLRHTQINKPIEPIIEASKTNMPSLSGTITKVNVKPAIIKPDTAVAHIISKAVVAAQLPASAHNLGYIVCIQANATGIANLHQWASYSSAVVATVPNHAQVRVLEKGDAFYKVAFNNQTGYLPKWVIPAP